MHIDHINISAPPDLLAEVRDFYCDVLGLTVGPRPDISRPGYWLYSEGKPILHLIESRDHFPSQRQGYLDHYALKGKGLSGVIGKLESAGVHYRLSHLPDIGMSQVFCRDPAGIRVEINFFDENG